MKRWRNKLLLLGGVAALGLTLPAFGQEATAPPPPEQNVQSPPSVAPPAAQPMAVGLARFGSSAAAQDGRNRDRASVTFTELNDSGLSGTAELTSRRQGTEVAMQIN